MLNIANFLSQNFPHQQQQYISPFTANGYCVENIRANVAAVTNQLVHPWCAKHAQREDLFELSREVQIASEEVKHMTCGKLQIIAEQIRFLQEQVISTYLDDCYNFKSSPLFSSMETTLIRHSRMIVPAI